MESAVEEDLQQQLADCYALGDAASLNRLLDTFRPFVLRVVRRRFDLRLQSRLDPADIVQETLLEVTHRLGEYVERRPMSFRAWLHQTACQRLQMAWREHRRAVRRSVDLEVPFVDDTSLQMACSLLGHNSPSDDLQRWEMLERVRCAIQQLPADDRNLIVMRNFDHLDNREVADLLGLQPAAASKRYGRALLRLRRHLKPTN